MEPRATFDPEAGALVVELADGVVSGTIPYPDDAHLVDIDAEGQVLALEILDPDHPLIDQIATRFGFEAQADAVASAINAVLPSRTTTTWWDVKYVQATVKLCHASVVAGKSKTVSLSPAHELDLIK
jgi:uncharacterized protein YuzE